MLYARKGPVAAWRRSPQVGKAPSSGQGSDVTIVATLLMVERALAAAETLAAEGIAAEVIDLRWLRPLDLATIGASVAQDRPPGHRRGAVARGRLGRDDHQRAGPGGTSVEDGARAVSLPYDLLIPYSPPLEDAVIPSVEAIVAAAKAAVESP